MFRTTPASGVTIIFKNNRSTHQHDIVTTLKRAKLMGTTRQAGVSAEVEDIRKWHAKHGYKGGLVLRELNTRLHHHYSYANNNTAQEQEQEFEFMDAWRWLAENAILSLL